MMTSFSDVFSLHSGFCDYYPDSFPYVLLKCFRISSRLPLDDVESIEQLVFNVTSSTGFDFALSSVDVRFVASLCVFLASLCSSKCRRCICVAAFPAFFCDVESMDELNLQQTSILSVWVELGLFCWKYVYCFFCSFVWACFELLMFSCWIDVGHLHKFRSVMYKA